MPVYSNVAATQGPFNLVGGAYGMTVHSGSWGAGSVTLQRLSPDNSTYVTVQAFSADGYASLNLSAGAYQIAVVTATGVYVDVTPIATQQY